LSVVYERPARSVPRFALITAPVLTFLFTGQEAFSVFLKFEISVRFVTFYIVTLFYCIGPIVDFLTILFSLILLVKLVRLSLVFIKGNFT